MQTEYSQTSMDSFAESFSFCEREIHINYVAFLMSAIVYSQQRYAVVRDQITLIQPTEILSTDGTNSIITTLGCALVSMQNLLSGLLRQSFPSHSGGQVHLQLPGLFLHVPEWQGLLMHSSMSKYRYRKVKKLMEDRIDRRIYLKG